MEDLKRFRAEQFIEGLDRAGRLMSWVAAADNHTTVRGYVSGYGVVVDGDATRERTLVLWGPDFAEGPQGRNARMAVERKRSVMLLDDGRTVSVWYCVGWHTEDQWVYFQPFPTNYGDDGARKVRADNGQPVDFADWALGPRLAVHLKARYV